MAVKPVDRQSTHLLERAGLFEEMGSAGYDRELALAAKLSLGLAVELEHLMVGPADDQQRRRSHRAQVPGEVGTSTARDDGTHLAARLGSRRQCGRRPGAGAEGAERQASHIVALREPGARRE